MHGDYRSHILVQQIESGATVGANSCIHACIVHQGAQIGQRCVLLDGAVIGANSIIMPGSLVAPFKNVPPSQIWGGCPAKFLRDRYDKSY
jgi:carbonic anhydrase/acetyltransferase-like protein (isoleucine patch superfamily)